MEELTSEASLGDFREDQCTGEKGHQQPNQRVTEEAA